MCWIVCLQLICELMCWPMDHGSSLLRQSRCAALQGSAISSIETSRGIAMSRNLYVNIFFKFDRLPQDRKMPKLMSLWLRRRRKRWKIRRDKSVHCFFLSHCSISFTCVCVRCACLNGSEVCVRCMNRTIFNWIGQNQQKSEERSGEKNQMATPSSSSIRRSVAVPFFCTSKFFCIVVFSAAVANCLRAVIFFLFSLSCVRLALFSIRSHRIKICVLMFCVRIYRHTMTKVWDNHMLFDITFGWIWWLP